MLVLSASWFGLCGAAAAQPAQAPASKPAAPAQPAPAPAPATSETPAPEANEPDTLAAPTPPPGDVALPEVAPIIDDAEFDAAIPPISVDDDPELDRPLESIAEFERRHGSDADRAGEAAAAAAPAPTITPAPALAEGDAADAIGAAPITDSELAAPLPALADFDVEPVEFAEPEAEGRDRSIEYSVRITGLDAADKEAGVDLGDLFDDLSALDSGDGKADNIAMLRARLGADAELMRQILASEGFYDAQVETRIERASAGGADGDNGAARGAARRGPLAAVIAVTPGPRYHFSAITIEADPTVPPGLVDDSFPLKVGDPIVADRVQGAEAAIALQLPQQGYPFVDVGQRDILLDGVTTEGAYRLPVTIGPRARFGGFETTGDLAFDAEHVGIMSRFKRGDLYDSRQVDDLRQALVATGLFSNVAVEPKQTGESAGDGTEYVTVEVTQDAGPPRTIAATAGYGTGEGVRLVGSWTHRNLFPPEGALTASATIGTQEQGLSLTMRRSNAGRRDKSVQLVAEGTRNRYDAYNALTGRVGVRWSYESTPLWQKKFTYAYGVDLIATREDDYDFDRGERVYDFYTILGLTGQVGMDRTDDLLDPHKGFRLTALIQPEGSMRGDFSPYARTQIDASGYYPVTDSLVLAGRVRVSSILGASREKLAPSRRFYAGGGGSVRGYGYQELGPKDPDNNPIGGRSLNEAAVEARYRFGNFGLVGFVDAGQVYTGSTPDFSGLRYGVGVGGRYYTNFGPVRFDIATPIDRQPGESKIAVYISIGQAF